MDTKQKELISCLAVVVAFPDLRQPSFSLDFSMRRRVVPEVRDKPSGSYFGFCLPYLEAWERRFFVFLKRGAKKAPGVIFWLFDRGAWR